MFTEGLTYRDLYMFDSTAIKIVCKKDGDGSLCASLCKQYKYNRSKNVKINW